MTPEQRKLLSQKLHAKMTPEQRSERAKKAGKASVLARSRDQFLEAAENEFKERKKVGNDNSFDSLDQE